jgi:hypothetical protein
VGSQPAPGSAELHIAAPRCFASGGLYITKHRLRSVHGSVTTVGANKIMPPAKKKKAATAALKPKEAHFARLEAALNQHNGKGSMLIMGVKSEDDEDDEDDDEEQDDDTEYTAEQMAELRHIIINDSRDEALKVGHSFASCGQSDSDCGFSMFNTSSGNEVVFGIPGAIKKALKKPTAAGQFDALFGLTHGLKSFDSWMNDNECWEPGCELEKAIKALAKAWKDTLKKGDAELGIDAEFTRPGIESLLQQLEDDFSSCEPTQDFKFKWCA